MKRLVILDLDNTLYDEKDYFLGVFNSFENKYGLIKAETLFKAFNSIDRLTSQDILRDILSEVSIYTRYNHDALFSCYCSSKFNLNLPKSSFFFLSFLKSKNIQTAILTNGVVSVQKNKVRNLNISSLVDKIFYSRSNFEHYEKPDFRCFKGTLEAFNCKPEDAIMIGDSYENDYLGGKNANIKSLWFRGNNVESIDTLEQALPLILGQSL